MAEMEAKSHGLGRKIDKPEKNKIATFIWLIGEQGTEIYNTLFSNDGTQNSMLGEKRLASDKVEQRSLDEVLKKFDDYCLPQKNVAMESFKFNTILQKEKQSINEFETELRKQLPFCEFKCSCGVSYENRMLRDRIIIGVHDRKLQLKFNLFWKQKQLQVFQLKRTSIQQESIPLNAFALIVDIHGLQNMQVNVRRRIVSAASVPKLDIMPECAAKKEECRNLKRIRTTMMTTVVIVDTTSEELAVSLGVKFKVGQKMVLRR